jgi:site-specific DNA-methyltransferase (adenine-specific)
MTKELLGSLELSRIYQRDCLEGSDLIESGSVDLILTDLPYGTMEGQSRTGIYHQGEERHTWDIKLPTEKIYDIANRILRKNGKMVLFAQSDFTFELYNKALPNLPYSYKMIWEKDSLGSFMRSKKAPLYQSEDVLVFSKRHDTNGIHPLRSYFKEVIEFIGLGLKEINTKLGHRRAEHTFYIESTQFSFCTEATYQELIKVFAIDTMSNFRSYEELKPIDDKFKKDLSSTFNLWEGKKYKSNILKYKRDNDGFHPTQKPVLLLEDIIKTFSNEGDLIVDLTCGSGSTCVAALRTGRKFIGFETESKYVEIANKRLDNETEAE